MSAMPETPYAEYWPDAWRFAFLMTGSAAAAQAVIEGMVPKAADRLLQMRDDRQARRWLFANLRERCRQAPPAPAPTAPESLDQPSLELARHFMALPEEERCALALFYLHRFQPDELGELLDLSPLELGRLLSAARQLLERRRELMPAAPTVRANVPRDEMVLVPPAAETG